MQRITTALGPDERIVFHHVPKTAGTSVAIILHGLFEPSQIVMGASGRNMRALSVDQLKRTRIFSGHLSASDIDLIPGRKRILTFLREPGARILSLYYYWRSMTESFAAGKPGPRIARRRSLLEFLRSDEPIIRSHIQNGMVRCFIPGGGLMADSPVIINSPPETLAEKAMDKLRTYHFVGFQETVEEDIGAMLRSIGQAPQPVPRKNGIADLRANDPRFEKVEREPITPKIEAELARLNLADSIFYQTALKERDQLRPPLL